MTAQQRRFAVALVAVCGFSAAAGGAQQRTLPLTPPRERGASITPAFEGWYENADGSFTMLVGYYNRNSRETLDIPAGPKNRVEPGPPDQGQPTFFETGRQWGVFTIKVPNDFGTKALTWTIVSNGEEQSVPFTLNKAYSITPFKERGMGNAPPVLAFSEGGAKVTGPPTGVASSYTGTLNQPVAINVWVDDPKGTDSEAGGGRGRGPRSIATVSLHKFRGPGQVTFDKARVPVPTQGAMIAAAATFDQPGEYLLRVQANDESGEGGGGFQCCWTNTYVRVVVQ
jgi:hypothetical protein